MLKLIFFAALIYYAYYFLIKPALLKGAENDEKPKIQIKNKKDSDDGEYIDYEEVE